MSKPTQDKNWENWEVISEFEDEEYHTIKILKDRSGQLHLVTDRFLLDGHPLPREFHSPGHYFESLGIPLDKSRCGRAFLDREISLKEAFRIWSKFNMPDEFEAFAIKK